MYYVTPKSPLDLYRTLLLIQSQKGTSTVVVNFNYQDIYDVNRGLEYHDVIKLFKPDGQRSLDIELWFKSSQSCYMTLAAAAVPRGKVYITDSMVVNWRNFGQYVFGNEAEQEDQRRYHEIRKGFVDGILTNAFDLSIDDLDTMASDCDIWLADDVMAVIGAKEITFSPNYNELPQKLELKPEALITINCCICENVANQYIETLQAHQWMETENLATVITSPGGDVYAIRDMMEARDRADIDTTTIAIGCAASAAGVFLIGGQKGKRFVTPNTVVMIHQFRGGSQTKALQNIQNVADTLTEVIMKGSGLSRERVRELLSRDTYLEPQEALNLGLIDGILK